MDVDQRLVFLLDRYGSETPAFSRPFSLSERLVFIEDLEKQALSERDRVILSRISGQLNPMTASSSYTVYQPYDHWIAAGYAEKGSLMVDLHGARSDGLFAATTFETSGSAFNFLDFSLKPRIYGTDDHSSAELLKLTGIIRYKKVGLEAGKSPVWWGSSYYTALPYSYNAEPLEMISLKTVDAFQLPWLFKYFGKIKFNFFYSKLDDSPRQHPLEDEFGYRFTSDFPEKKTYDNPELIGQVVSFSVHREFEVTLGKTTMFGGINPVTGEDVSANWGFDEYWNVFWGLDQYHDEPGGTVSKGKYIQENSNSMAVIDMKWRMPWLADILWLDHLTTYFVQLSDDVDWVYLNDNLPGLKSNGFVAGMKSAKGAWNVVFEYYNPENYLFRFYEHNRYRAGHSYRGKWLGSPFGGDSEYYFGRVEREVIGSQIGIQLLHGQKKNKAYGLPDYYVPNQAQAVKFTSLALNIAVFDWLNSTVNFQTQGDWIENAGFFEGRNTTHFSGIINYRHNF